MKISQNGIDVAHYFEQCKLKAYPDPGSKDGNPWTIGWGHTGPEVVEGLTWTQAQADAAFLEDIAESERAVEDLVGVKLCQGEFDALVLFVYNIGISAFKASTMLRLLDACDLDGARGQFKRWDKNDGKVMRGLTRRRAAEVALWDGAGGREAITRGVAAA